MGRLSSSRWMSFFVLTIVLIIVVISFSPSLKNGFVNWDDEGHLLNNSAIRGLDFKHLKEIFQQRINTIYLPLTLLTFAIEYHFFGFNPFVYHLNNLLFHLIVTVLVFIFFRRIGATIMAASFATLLFGIHPMRVESVAWITERKDVVYAFFYMLALVCYYRHIAAVSQNRGKEKDNYSYGYLVLTTLLGSLSMLAKPMALSLPSILLLSDWFRKRKFSMEILVEKIPLVIMIGAVGWITYEQQARIPQNTLLGGFMTWVWSFIFYLRQFLLPFFLVPIYRLPKPVSIFHATYFLSILAFIMVLCVLWRFRKNRWVIFAFFFYFFSIFFLLRFDDSDINVVADRFMYLPSLGPCLLLGLFFEHWLFVAQGRKRGEKISMIVGVVLFFLVFSFKTFQQCRVWKNGESLWRHQLLFFPNEWLALNNLANAYLEGATYQQSLKEYRQKVQNSQQSSYTLNLDISSVNRMEYLIQFYKKAIQSHPQYRDAHFNLAKLYRDLGRFPDAIEFYKRCVEVEPMDHDAYYNLGRIYQQVDDPRKAIEAFAQAIRTSPDEEFIYIDVIRAYSQALEADESKILYQQARSKVLQAYQSLAKSPQAATPMRLWTYYRYNGQDVKAVESLQKAIDLNPDYVQALYDLESML